MFDIVCEVDLRIMKEWTSGGMMNINKDVAYKPVQCVALVHFIRKRKEPVRTLILCI